MSLYMFLLERAHVVRAPFIRKRTDDWVWAGGMSFVVVAFGAIAVWSLITPHAKLSAEDGQCRIGLATVPAYLLLIFDAFINASLTVVFVILLRPVLKFRERTSPYYDDGSTLPSVSRLRRLVRQLGSLGFKEEEVRDNFFINIKKVLWKNVIGSSVSFIASAANLVVFLSEKGNQLAFVCLVACIADVTCGVLVVHWLTLGSNDETRTPQRPNPNHTPMFNNPLYSDVIIRHTHGGVTRQYHAHKAILSAGSPWFLDVLAHIHNGTEPIVIPEDDDPKHFEVALRFLYTRKIDAGVISEPSSSLSRPYKPTDSSRYNPYRLRVKRALQTLLSIHSLADKYEIEGLQAHLSRHMPNSVGLCTTWGPHFSGHLQQFVQEHYRACIEKDCMMGRQVCSMILQYGGERYVKDPAFDDLMARWPKFCADMFREARDNDRIFFGTRHNPNTPVRRTDLLANGMEH
ncbi:uncharacterized protein N0V89_006583 [Didymosphaeria variabile]|uniref:BTB domain-containing protein n=1 Tax=Didymosphaeria variabile TaxID=1932322 RepID=A0A9W8XHM0_9PLEO|nr:uncharacterized protein N0V89_006583 [Didymosphaeria variabile]KAJ4351244.1 hypothetical protein N0V89_006583 [Didymosphaeria variabile]